MILSKNILFLFLFLLPFISSGQEESAPKVDPNKSWGLGLTTGDSWNYHFGFKAFYQKSKNQFELNINTDFYGFNFDLGYIYYPNEWKKRADLRIMINASPYYYKSDDYTSKGASLFIGTGIRLRCLKHFYITGSIQMGESFYHSTRQFYTGSNYYLISRAKAELSLSINLNSFRWKRD